MTLATPASLDKWEHLHPGKRRCDVYRVMGAADCAGTSAAWYTAECEHGHVMEGGACSPCINAVMLGCGRCWIEDRRIAKVTVRWEELAEVAP
jgi:hypothetical protein